METVSFASLPVHIYLLEALGLFVIRLPGDIRNRHFHVQSTHHHLVALETHVLELLDSFFPSIHCPTHGNIEQAQEKTLQGPSLFPKEYSLLVPSIQSPSDPEPQSWQRFSSGREHAPRSLSVS